MCLNAAFPVIRSQVMKWSSSQAIKMIPFIQTSVSYSKSNKTIKFDWETNMNTSSIYYQCSDGSAVLSNTENRLLPPVDAPGKTYDCFMQINQTRSNIALVQISLASVSELILTSPTANTLNLSFTKPNGIYDNLQLTCDSTNDRPFSSNYALSYLSFTKNISYSEAIKQSYVFKVGSAIAGLYYDCLMKTSKFGFNDELSPENGTKILISKCG
jgi:hypothetical protein